jgi:serine/threonine protein kinase
MGVKKSFLSRLFSWGRSGMETIGPQSSSWEPGQVLLSDFKVEGILGKGGMGQVYLVHSLSTGQAFAVKKTLLNDETSRRNFLTELQTWIDLPENPHLTACRFFRTIADEVAVFAEFVDGGSLADWIRQGRVNRLDQILDLAIQSAWGLHAAHEAGLVHQDVKPGNMLLTRDGLLKITDFGLARAREVAGEKKASAPGQSLLVSMGGMTPEYCSPEQAAGQKLTRKTDIWSWGVSVLEMFTGEVTWGHGTVAGEALEDYLEGGGQAPGRPKIPGPVGKVLQRCFQSDPGGVGTIWAK